MHNVVISGTGLYTPANSISNEELVQSFNTYVHQFNADNAAAIERGGTTLRDFIGGDGQPGYFQQELFVYGRGGEACKVCGSELRNVVLGQRASVFCPKCQS